MNENSPGTARPSAKNADTGATPAQAKNRVALSSVLAALLLTGMKLVVGLMTGSLGILSEAAHSALDLGAAFMTLIAVRISDRPADESHHYGHGKIEGLSALFEVLLLLGTCAYIIYEAARRIASDAPPHVEVNVWAFAVMGVSIVVDISRSTALYRTAKKYRSQALEADALHFSSDIFSSLVVIAGLAGYRFGFAMADSIAALLVAALVIVVSVRLALRTVDVLLDRAPRGLRREIEKAVMGTEGVSAVDSLRVRTSGARTFVDMRVRVDGGLSFRDAHGVSSGIEEKVMGLVPEADVMVHADPCDTGASFADTKSTVSKVLKGHGDMIEGYHNLRVFRHGGRHTVNLHLEMKGDTRIADAHAVCDHLERDIKKALPGAEVMIHVEPSRKK